jgi:hypothetical protein
MAYGIDDLLLDDRQDLIFGLLEFGECGRLILSSGR